MHAEQRDETGILPPHHETATSELDKCKSTCPVLQIQMQRHGTSQTPSIGPGNVVGSHCNLCNWIWEPSYYASYHPSTRRVPLNWVSARGEVVACFLLSFVARLDFSCCCCYAGCEADYTSSHTQFMDTCDYIWFTQEPVNCSSSEIGYAKPGGHASEHGASSSSSSNDFGSRVEVEKEGESVASNGLQSNCGTREGVDAGERSESSVRGAGTIVQYELHPVAVLLPPEGHRLQKGLPSKFLGSDHVCLVVDFEVSLE